MLPIALIASTMLPMALTALLTATTLVGGSAASVRGPALSVRESAPSVRGSSPSVRGSSSLVRRRGSSQAVVRPLLTYRHSTPRPWLAALTRAQALRRQLPSPGATRGFPFTVRKLSKVGLRVIFLVWLRLF